MFRITAVFCRGEGESDSVVLISLSISGHGSLLSLIMAHIESRCSTTAEMDFPQIARLSIDNTGCVRLRESATVPSCYGEQKEHLIDALRGYS